MPPRICGKTDRQPGSRRLQNAKRKQRAMRTGDSAHGSFHFRNGLHQNGLHQKLFAELLRGFGHYSENGGTIVKTPIILTVNNRIMDKNTVIKFKDLLFDFILLKLNTCYTLLYIY